MWSLFPELIGPIAAAFVAGSAVAWATITVVLRPLDDKQAATPSVTRGP